MTDRKIPTNSLIERAKRESKLLVSPGRTHYEALDEQAVLAGYPDWRTLAMANKKRNLERIISIPLDPDLPRKFDNTPHDERSKNELALWWNKPYILSSENGQFEVRCLDGGAWDRSTMYGITDTLDEARKLAQEKLKQWLKMMTTPVSMMRADGLVDLVILSHRPGVETEVLATGLTPDAAREALEKLQA